MLMALGGGKDRKERCLQRVNLSLGGRCANQIDCEALQQKKLTGGGWNSKQGGKPSPRWVQRVLHWAVRAASAWLWHY